MSYYKVKSISIKNNSITVTAASNNCLPITFSTQEYKGDKTDLLNDLVGGMMQPYYTAQNLRYFKAIKFVRENLDNVTGIEEASFYEIIGVKKLLEKGAFDEEQKSLMAAIQNNPDSKDYWTSKLHKLNEYKSLFESDRRNEFNTFIGQAIEIMEKKPSKEKVYLKTQSGYILKKGKSYYLSTVKPSKPFTLDQAEMTRETLSHLEIETVTA